MDYLDTAIVLTLVIITVAEFSALVTDRLILMAGSRTRGFEEWCQCVVEEVRLSLRDDVEFNVTQSASVLEQLNMLMASERDKPQPYLNRSVLMNNILSTALKVSTPKVVTTLEQVLPDRVGKCDHRATSQFRLRTGIKVACVATVISLALNINSVSLISELESNDANKVARLQTQVESLNDKLQAESDPTNAGSIMIELRNRLNQLSTEETKTFSVGPLAQGINRMSIDWIFGCVLTGLLAGLGAPFWRRQLSRLMVLKDTKEAVSVTTPANQNRYDEKEEIQTDPAVTVSSGVTGQFAPTNISWDPLTKQIDLDVIALGKPESTYTPDELAHTLREKLAPLYSKKLAAVNIRPDSLNKMAGYFFTSNGV